MNMMLVCMYCFAHWLERAAEATLRCFSYRSMQNAEDGEGDGGFNVFKLTIRVKVVGTLYIARQLLLCTEVQTSVQKYSGQFCTTVRLPPLPHFTPSLTALCIPAVSTLFLAHHPPACWEVAWIISTCTQEKQFVKSCMTSKKIVVGCLQLHSAMILCPTFICAFPLFSKQEKKSV